MDHSEPVDVYQAINAVEAEIVRGMLDAEGLRAEVAGNIQGGFTGAIPEISVMVAAVDADRARALIQAHQASRVEEESVPEAL